MKIQDDRSKNTDYRDNIEKTEQQNVTTTQQKLPSRYNFYKGNEYLIWKFTFI